MTQSVAAPESFERPRYLEAPQALVFPVEEEVPETQLHLELRTLLYQLLKGYLAASATVGSDQFVYYAADDPKQCLAPDVYVKAVAPNGDIRSWKTWERGAPDVAVEIVSESDAPELPWREKLARYARMGVKQVVRFDTRKSPGQQLRIWDRVTESLAEREVSGDCAPSLVLGITWVVAPADGRPRVLRIATDREGKELVPTAAEAREAEAKAREAAEGRAAEAEARVRELEAELKLRGG
jgi:Uma2 family endonuclease